MVEIKIIPLQEFQRIRQAPVETDRRLQLIADMCRFNTLASVKLAGSGHLGSSLSAMDIVTMLFYGEMNIRDVGVGHPDRDIYFSSKGHDVPGLYAILFSLGILPRERFLKLRRLGGTQGHPDVRIEGIEANSGSLGMGISKGKGMAAAKHLMDRGGRIFVLTGDGELQEGQIYEALQTAAYQGITNLNVIIDHNKVQSDKLVEEIGDLGDMEAKLSAFGWHVERCNGHDFKGLERVFSSFRTVEGRPKILIADTIKGRGVSFMEHPEALNAGKGLYRWHAGAPDDEAFARAHEEILLRINESLSTSGIAPITLEDVSPGEKGPSGVTREYVADAFGEALVEIGGARTDLVVLDADLASDCRVRDFERTYPARFIENGIAEQDMVSMAGGLALQGLLPVVNTFGAFLASRANEQIYTNACEGTKIIYVCHYSGLIPAGPGASHQSIRDISLFGALPDFLIMQPCNGAETRMSLEYMVNEARENGVLRLIIGPSPRAIALPPGYRMIPGQGVALTEGSDAALFAYGPVMVHEALLAAEILEKKGLSIKVINMPWLNRVDADWCKDTLASCEGIYVLEDHSPVGGLGDFLLNALVDSRILRQRTFRKLGVRGYPACGTPQEVLRYHGLDGESIAATVAGDMEG